MKRAAGAALAALAVLLAIVLAPLVATSFREKEERHAAAPKEGRFVDVGDGEVFVQVFGPEKAPVALFTHGMGAWSGLWRPVLEGLPVRCVVVDLPPFGYSGAVRGGDWSRKAQGRRLWAVLDALGVRKASLVGHSFGSGSVAEAALAHPERVEKLVLFAPALSIGDGGKKDGPPFFLRGPLALLTTSATLANPLLTRRGLAGFMARKEAADDARVAVLRRPQSVRGYAAGLAAWLPFFASGGDDGDSFRLQSYKRLAMPTVLVYGDQDRTTPVVQGRELSKMMPDAELVVLPGLGHMPQLEDPEKARLILAGALR